MAWLIDGWIIKVVIVIIIAGWVGNILQYVEFDHMYIYTHTLSLFWSGFWRFFFFFDYVINIVCRVRGVEFVDIRYVCI